MLASAADAARCRELLKNRPRSVLYRDIAERQGISLRWLEEFARGRNASGQKKCVDKVLAFFADQQG